VANIDILQAGGARVERAADNGREHCARSIVTSEARLAQKRAAVQYDTVD
jgi:hypothetical protein